jgi:hypothetical protein
MHFYVDQSRVPFSLGQSRHGIAGAFSGLNLVALFAEPFAQRIANAQFIVNDQQPAL